MADQMQLLREGIIRDMSEAVITIGFNGTIGIANPAAEKILEISASELVGHAFAACFFDHSENDAFNQAVLEAIYDRESSHESVVEYYTGEKFKTLHITTSFLRDGDERVGVIAVLSDISELVELRDAIKAMERIKLLNNQLELRNKLLGETFGRYLSDEIVKQLLDTPDGLALGGSKRELTVMMSDLRGFTAISERMQANELLDMLNHYLGVMTDIILDSNGTIIEFIGDGILAIFGAPAHSGRHALDATVCAVKMQAAMDGVRQWNRQRGYPLLEMGIGVNTGEMIVGNIGSSKRTKYGVAGRHVNLCGRIESYTVGGQVLISPRTREQANVPLDVERELDIYPKGVGKPLRVSQVTGVGEPFNVRCVTRADTPEPCRPVPVEFCEIHDKHCEAAELSGRFVAISDTGAILESGAGIQPLANLKLETCLGSVFAKVLESTNDGYILRFTSLPDGFSASKLLDE